MTEVTVTQADRITADALFGNGGWGSEQFLSGKRDKKPKVQIIARHREEAVAALKADNERLREALERCATIVERNNGRQNEKVDDVVYIARTILAETKGESERVGGGA